jgi:benzoylformate decarboxylase
MPSTAPDSGFVRVEDVPTRRGAQVLLEVLESEGVEYIFGNPGTTELPLIDALLGPTPIRYVLALQEASVVAMADGYAQASGRPGFANLHTAGGLGHGMGNLLNAQVHGTPLVVTAGQQDSRHALMDPLLFGDLVGIATPSVKWAREVTRADQIPVLVRRAFHDCGAAPSGPVFLSLPMDMMEEMTGVGIAQRSTIDTRAVAGGLDRLAGLLASFAPGRLALIAGDEVGSSGATAQAVALAEALGAPVYGSSWPAHLPFPTAHPLWSGNLPTRASGIADELAPFDGVFALGGKSLITILYSEGSAVPPGCRVFQLSSDVRDLGRSYSTELSMQGDIRASLDALLPPLRRSLQARRPELDAAAATHGARMRARHAALEERAEREAGRTPITPLVAAREILRAVGPGVPIVDEAIATSGFLRSPLRDETVRSYAFLRGGALGWGLPAAAGYKPGHRPRAGGLPGGRRRPVLAAGAVDPGARAAAGHGRGDEQPGVQRAQELHEGTGALPVGSQQPLHRHGPGRAGHRLPGAGRLHGRRRAPGGARQRHRTAVQAGIASGLPNLIEVRISAT